MKVKSDDRTVGEVLNGYFFKVPRFQRPYEWTVNEVDEFWSDVTDAGDDYFIGSMVLFQSTHGVQGIVDGQQRLTTMTLLLCALRDAMRRAGLNDEAEGLHNLIERRSVRDNKSHFVLQTDNNDPYLRYVQDKDHGEPVPLPSDREKRLRIAYERIRGYISGVADAGAGGSALIDLREKILNLRLITVEVDNEEDATVIFQTLNSRGRDLEAADLVKSHLFSTLRANNPSNDSPRDQWESIVDLFSASQADLPMDRFLLHSWLSRNGYLAQAALGKTVRKNVRKQDAKKFLEDLVLDARLYREIHEPSVRQTWQQEERPLREALEALQLFRVRQPMPWVLAVWREYDQKRIKLKHALNALLAVERFHFVATAITSQPSSGGVSKMYASHARQLTNAKTLPAKAAVIRDINDKLGAAERFPSFDVFAASFALVKSSRNFTQQSRLSLYILRRIHAHQSRSPADFSMMTVEHIAPQSIKKGKLLSHGQVAQLGNLALLPRPINDELGDKDFSEKLKILLRASADGVYVDPQILSSSSWGPTEILGRTRSMAEVAYNEVWAMPK